MDERYRVVYPGTVLENFRRICSRADELGILSAVKSAAITIHAQLQSEPHRFGDPSYSLSFTRQVVYVRSISPLVVHYAIHRDKKLVVVKSIDWVPTTRQ